MSFECQHCFKTYQRKGAFINHLKNEHDEVSHLAPKKDKKGMLVCTKCDFKTKYPNSFKRHQDNCRTKYEKFIDLMKSIKFTSKQRQEIGQLLDRLNNTECDSDDDDEDSEDNVSYEGYVSKARRLELLKGVKESPEEELVAEQHTSDAEESEEEYQKFATFDTLGNKYVVNKENDKIFNYPGVDEIDDISQLGEAIGLYNKGDYVWF